MLGPGHTQTSVRNRARRPQVAVRISLSALLIVPVLIAAGSPAGALSLNDSELLDFMRRGLDRHPSVMLAGIAALTVPVVALIAAVWRGIYRWRDRRSQRFAPPPIHRVFGQPAWIEVHGLRLPPVNVGEILRIGDSDDCDLEVAGASTGGTCALIQRTSDCEFILFDVSAGAAHLAVNGARSEMHHLYDGDRIEIGSARLVFRTGDAPPLPSNTRVHEVS